ncbi:MAG TPA: hypothetical protein VJ729_10305 [Nitrososphaeraceae archaeon]|nr:hypothetical protein [Nitrososphaeraceae archaeon]
MTIQASDKNPHRENTLTSFRNVNPRHKRLTTRPRKDGIVIP